MRKTLISASALLCLFAASASAQAPTIPRGPITPPGPSPLLCTDLAIAGWNGTRSPPDGRRLAANEVAIHFQVRNNGPRTYTAPDENKQWITLVVDMPSGPVELSANVLPPSTSGVAVSLARGESWRGVIRGTLPPGVTRDRHPPARLQLNYAAATTSWTPRDCVVTNNSRTIVFN